MRVLGNVQNGARDDKGNPATQPNVVFGLPVVDSRHQFQGAARVIGKAQLVTLLLILGGSICAKQHRLFSRPVRHNGLLSFKTTVDVVHSEIFGDIPARFDDVGLGVKRSVVCVQCQIVRRGHDNTIRQRKLRPGCGLVYHARGFVAVTRRRQVDALGTQVKPTTE